MRFGYKSAGRGIGYRSKSVSLPAPIAIRINAGGGTYGRWDSEAAYVSGGTAFDSGSTGFELNTRIRPGRPQDSDAGAVYGQWRIGAGPIGYLFTPADGLEPLTNYRVRAHAVDIGFSFRQSINANGVEKVADYVIQTYAGGAAKGGIKEFDVTSDSDGEILLEFIGQGGQQAAVAAIEVHKPTPQYVRYNFLGDSITEGGGGVDPDTKAWASLFGLDIDANIVNTNLGFNRVYDETRTKLVHVVAQSGTGLEQQRIYLNDFVVGIHEPFYTKEVVSLLCGYNDIVNLGETAATIIGWIDDLFADADAISGVKKVVCKILPATTITGGMITVWNDVNDWIEANSLGADAVVDLAAEDTRLADPTDTLIYSDGIHPTILGHSIIKDVMKPIILGL